MVDKNVLRKVYLEKRLFLSEDEYTKRNRMLLERLFSHIQFDRYQWAHAFLAILDKKEVDTWQIIDQLREAHPSIKVAISKTLPEGVLTHYMYNEQTEVKVNKWGIHQPVSGKLIDETELDLVLVPLISFDKAGHRIGYGKGYYDRFLKKAPNAYKVGLSLSPPLDIIQYANKMDVKLDCCITPFETYNF